MKSWQFSTEHTTRNDRSYVWREAMDTLRLPMPPGDTIDDAFHGDVVGLVSPMGVEFSRVSATPHTISGCYSDQPSALWLALLLEGASAFTGQGENVELRRGDILYGPSGCDSTLELRDDFRLLYVRVPCVLLNPTLLGPASMRFGILPAQSRLTRVMTGMLRAVGDDLEAFDATEIHPVEIALSEFVVASLASSQTMRRFGERSRAAHFQRICQSIEQQLTDGELSVGKVSAQQNVSPRYLQKLFEEAGSSFTQYVRDRRLERCHIDLLSPAHQTLSILEICFRWGFNDAAHFSRSFRAKFGVTPRACRLAGQHFSCIAS